MQHNCLPTAQLAGVSGGMQVRAAQNNRLRSTAQLY